MTRLCLVRHGQTAWNLEGRWQGHADPPLNVTGFDQARLLASELANLSFDAIYSSDLQRARATAEAVATNQALFVKTEPRLRELSMGEWEGKLISEIPVLYPAAWAERQRNPVEAQPPGGESVKQLSQRINAAIAEICAENPPEHQILIVSHGLALAVFLCHANGRPLGQAFDHIPRNATPTHLDWPQ
jgi:broad specificity phosphatase PhoE